MNQEQLEEHFSRKKSREYVYDLLTSQDMSMDAICEGIALLEAWTILPSDYEAKRTRRDTLANMNIQKIVESLLVDILMLRKTVTLANMATQLGMSLGFQEAKQGITLAGEIIAICSAIGFYKVQRAKVGGSYYIVPLVFLDNDERLIAERGMYMPPLIERPKKLKSNYSSPYQSLKGESLILKHYNHHNEDISLDVLNTQNNIALSLNIDFLNEVEEEPTTDLNTIKGINLVPKAIAMRMIKLQKENWELHLDQSNYVYQTLYDNGNRFYIPNKVDKRGRIYAQGYHVNPQGASYKKSMLELTKQSHINVPKGFFI